MYITFEIMEENYKKMENVIHVMLIMFTTALMMTEEMMSIKMRRFHLLIMEKKNQIIVM